MKDTLFMLKLGISLLFFTLSLLISSSSFAQAETDLRGSININVDSLFHGLNGELNGIITDSTLNQWRGILPDLQKQPSKHYVEKDDRRYYIDIIPPGKKAKEVDH